MLLKSAFASLAVLALVCALSVAGCQSQSNRLVGTWAPSSGSGLTWQFTQDGKLVEAAPSTAGTFQNVKGTYSLSGNTLTLTVPTKGGGSVPTTLTIEWVSDNEFRISMGSMPLTFTRQK